MSWPDAGERDSFIREYYAATYRSVAKNVNGHSISNFLGDMANHPKVLASKLNQEERDDLEKDISINEFDKALEKAKLNTAPGIDSISNRFIKTFWHIFHVPLFEYTKCCYGKGTQTENFRCAKIRLIPKKEDLTVQKKLALYQFTQLFL